MKKQFFCLELLYACPVNITDMVIYMNKMTELHW
uniref:Uncharacterized protein n=1 Tax=Anguilla anguilla TaxID=7936 RepID=A0A0E9PXN7_ANGAN